ncbi:hypothetical protein WDW37_15450, partial [Bdellovibrionota bacterium FG-1]
NINPGAAALGLTAGYYDFGYNLFVDRWTAACNWTSQASGGMCGIGASAGDCFASLGRDGGGLRIKPSDTIGAIGNVFYDRKANICWIKVAAGLNGWKSSNDTLTTAQRAAMYTITPSVAAPKPPIAMIYQTPANDTCVAAADPDYGAKRLLRRREYIAAAAWPMEWSTAAIDTMEYSTDVDHLTNAAKARCNTNPTTGLTCNFPTGDCASDINANFRQVVTGAISTKNCSSRFGAQDMVGNVNQYVSDQIDQCNAGSSHSCTGITSSVDSGNRDLNGFQFDGAGGNTGNHGPGGLNNGQISSDDGWHNGTLSWLFSVGVKNSSAGVAQGFGAGYFSAPMGLPMMGDDSGNALEIGVGISTAKLQGDFFGLWSDATSLYTNAYDVPNVEAYGPLRGAIVGSPWYEGAATAGRWELMFGSPSSTYPDVGFRCSVAPSEQ